MTISQDIKVKSVKLGSIEMMLASGGVDGLSTILSVLQSLIP
jgi:hypothetical protein